MSKLFPITPKFWILIVYNLYEGNDHIFSNGIIKFDYEPTLGHPIEQGRLQGNLSRGRVGRGGDVGG